MIRRGACPLFIIRKICERILNAQQENAVRRVFSAFCAVNGVIRITEHCFGYLLFFRGGKSQIIKIMIQPFPQGTGLPGYPNGCLIGKGVYIYA